MKMTTQNVSLPDQIRSAMDRLEIGQGAVAASCGYTQSYISKALNRKVKITKSLERKLNAWLANLPSGDQVGEEEVEEIIRRLVRTDSAKRMHIIHILRGLMEIS